MNDLDYFYKAITSPVADVIGFVVFLYLVYVPDFDSFRHNKPLLKGVAIAFEQGQLVIIFLYTFFYIRNISYKRNFIHLYRINYIQILS